MSTRQQTMPQIRELIANGTLKPGVIWTTKDLHKFLKQRGIKRDQRQVTMAMHNLYEYDEVERVSRGTYKIPGRKQQVHALNEPIKSAAADSRPAPIKIPAKSSYPRVVGELTTGEIIMSFNGNVYSCTQI